MSELFQSLKLSRWEHGSAIELGPVPNGVVAYPVVHGAEIRFGTARQAFLALFELLADERPLRRILFPDVYCHAVTLAVRSRLRGRCEVATYPSTPGRAVELDCRNDDVVVVSSTLGLVPAILIDGGAVIVADTSHGTAPHSATALNQVDYQITSLRKLHGVADGALLSAPRRAALPSQPDPSSDFEEFAALLDDALQMKASFLAGTPVRKGDFLAAIRKFESELSRHTEPADMSSRSQQRWFFADSNSAISAAVANTRALALEMASFESSRPESGPSAQSVQVGFGGTFIPLTVQDPRLKSALRSALIRRSIWPATLWPIPDSIAVASDSRACVETTLVVNADSRYDSAHMCEVGQRLADAFLELGLRCELVDLCAAGADQSSPVR